MGLKLEVSEKLPQGLIIIIIIIVPAFQKDASAKKIIYYFLCATLSNCGKALKPSPTKCGLKSITWPGE
jgi:hypothetical protein